MTFPLVLANNLADYIIGTVLGACDIEAAVSKYGPDIINSHNMGTPVADIISEMSAKLKGEGVTMNTFTVENIYTNSSESLQNKAVWSSTEDLVAGRASVSSVSPLDFLVISTILNHVRFRDPSSWINFSQANYLQLTRCTAILPQRSK